jgi:iron complex outermembrane recepter protein
MQKAQSLTLAKLTFAVSVAVLGLSSVQAQDAGLEEITVTARKREESLKDVSISVNVISAERLEAGNINKVGDLTEFVPNLNMTETAVSTQVYIRGIGSGNNQGFEQSVGQYVDGVYYGRQMLLRVPYLDLARVEVLRGPQTTLFGKNSIAGALNYTTAHAGDSNELSLYSLHEFESGQTELNAMASGPLSDTLRARVAWRGYDEDGYVENTTRHTDEPARNENTYRLTLDWDASERLQASLKIERSAFDTTGRQIEVVRDDPNLFPAGSSPLAGRNMSQILSLFGQPAMDAQLDFKRQVNTPERSDNSMENQTLTVKYDFDVFALTSITGRVRYDFNESCDCDYTPANSFNIQLAESYSQWSQEFRFASAQGQKLEWLAGGFFQDADMTSLEVLDIPTDSLLRTLALASTDPARRSLLALTGTRLKRDNGQDSKTSAVFVQGTWNLNDSLRLTLGGRFTQEDKDGYRSMNAQDLATLQAAVNPATALVYFGAFRIYTEQLAGKTIAPGVVAPGHNLSGDRSESQFTPAINLEWDFNDDTMLYASATSGYKAGGFDGRANNPFSFEFEEEKARSYEVGAKNRLFDNAVELNVAYYFTDYENLQISQYDGSFGFNVGNAKAARVQGLELDGRWAATDELTVAYSYSWLDFEFTDFRNGNCYNRQVPDSVVVNGIKMCDYTGKRGQYTPKHSMSLAFDYTRPLGDNGLMIVSSLMYNYRSEQNIHDNLDPNMTIDAVGRVNVRLGVEGNNWQLGFIGKNLTAEKVLTYAGNVPLSASTFGTNSYYGVVDRGRQLALELGYTF